MEWASDLDFRSARRSAQVPRPCASSPAAPSGERERFEVGLGDDASWRIGPYAQQGFSAGSRRLSRVRGPIAAGNWSRYNTALYGDVEVRGARRRLDGRRSALRLEDFDGFRALPRNGKLAGRYRLAGAVATALPAPAPVSGHRRRASTQAFNVLDRVRPRADGSGQQRRRFRRTSGAWPGCAAASRCSPNAQVNYAARSPWSTAGRSTSRRTSFRIRLKDRLALTQLFALEHRRRSTACSPRA